MEYKDIKRTFIASSEIFTDYSYDISLVEVSTLDDIIEVFKNSLIELFKKNNLTTLKKMVEEKNFHIHSYTIEDVLTSSDESIFYICDHE